MYILDITNKSHKHAQFYLLLTTMYRISWPIRPAFFPEKCDLDLTCILCTEGKYYFKTYKYPYIYCTHLYRESVKTTMKMILVAVTTIFWVSVMNKLYYGC